MILSCISASLWIYHSYWILAKSEVVLVRRIAISRSNKVSAELCRSSCCTTWKISNRLNNVPCSDDLHDSISTLAESSLLHVQKLNIQRQRHFVCCYRAMRSPHRQQTILANWSRPKKPRNVIIVVDIILTFYDFNDPKRGTQRGIDHLAYEFLLRTARGCAMLMPTPDTLQFHRNVRAIF